MTVDEKLVERLKSPEDRFVERKQNISKDEICKTLVAFANSLPESDEGYLSIGITDDGKLIGVDNPDDIQKKVRNWAEAVCYPSIRIQCQTVKSEGKDIVAITVYPSENRPHFSGNSYVRIGSESKKASAEMFEELIISRNDIAKRLLKAKNNREEILLNVPLSYNPDYRVQCYVEDCNSFYAIFKGVKILENHSAPLNKISISWEGIMNMLLITISH